MTERVTAWAASRMSAYSLRPRQDFALLLVGMCSEIMGLEILAVLRV